MERELFNDRLAVLEKLFQRSALELSEIDVPVIFDVGYWTAEHRAAALKWGRQNSLVCEMHFLDTPFKICKQRATERNSSYDSEFYEMTPQMLEMFWSWFEVPGPTEGVLRVSRT